MLFPSGLVSTSVMTTDNVTGVEKLWLETSHGRVEAWYMAPEPLPSSKKIPALIFAHGNGELIDIWPPEFKKLSTLGMGILLVEYPGYGRSQGSPSQETVTETFLKAYDAIVEREEIDASRIVLMGRSLGGGAICTLAARRPSVALILMSTFTSVRSFAHRYFVPGFLTRDPFDNLEVVRSYPGPVLIIHGTHDEVIPYRHGKILYRTAQYGEMLSYPSGHNDCPPDWSAFKKDLESFFIKERIIEPQGCIQDEMKSDGDAQQAAP
jgi:fermentation-respiration switch protein FrsA (DUF1100 family)